MIANILITLFFVAAVVLTFFFMVLPLVHSFLSRTVGVREDRRSF